MKGSYIALLVVAALPRVASAELGRCPPSCSLDDLRRRAEAMAPDLAQAEAAARYAEARREEAWAAPASATRARLDMEPTALRAGDVLHSDQTDASFSRDMGLTVRLRIYTVAPVTSWWRILSLWRVADSGVALAEGDVARRRASARVALERAFRAAQLARAQSAALHAAHARLARALALVEMRLDEDLPGAAETDRLRLEVRLSDLEARQAAASRSRRRSDARIRELAALPPGTRIPMGSLPEPPRASAPLEWYLESARRQRPEVPMSLAAVRGARSAIALRFGELVPDLGVAGYVSLRAAPLVDDQRSSFVRDLWNGLSAGYGAVVEWNLDPVGIAARVGQARADLAQARAMRRLALGAVAYEVESAYAEAIMTEAALGARRRGRDAATRWLEASIDDLAHGRGDASTASRAVSTWLRQELAWQGASRDHLVALVRLEGAAGLAPGSLAGNE